MTASLRIEDELVAGRPETTLVRVGGFIDTHTAEELERRLFAALASGRRHLVVDLANVDYVSSAGWGVFVSVVRRAREAAGDLVLAGLSREVRDVFELLEFSSLMSAHADVHAALEALGTPA